MSGIQLPAGKFVPPIQPNPDINRAVQRTSTTTPAVSFSNELQARIQSVPVSPSQIQSETAPPIQAIPVPKTLPSQVATGQAFEESIIQNWQQYQTMNSHQAAPAVAMPMSAASQSALQSAMYNAQTAANPAQTQQMAVQPNPYAAPAPNTDQPSQAMNSIFARNFNQADSTSAQSGINPIESQPINIPAPEVVITPEEAAQLDAFIAGQPIQQNGNTSRIKKYDPQNGQNQMTQQSNDSEKKKGFFKSVGSFFKNIASGLTLGFYRPDNEPSPQGLARAAEPFKKIIWDAPKSLLIDAPAGAYHSLKNSFGDNETDSQSSIATSPNAQQVIDAGEKIIASRRGKAHNGLGSKPHLYRVS